MRQRFVNAYDHDLGFLIGYAITICDKLLPFIWSKMKSSGNLKLS